MEEIEYFFTCPHCWEEISVLIDLSVPSDTVIEDCEVCCEPIEITYSAEDGEIVEFSAEASE